MRDFNGKSDDEEGDEADVTTVDKEEMEGETKDNDSYTHDDVHISRYRNTQLDALSDADIRGCRRGKQTKQIWTTCKYMYCHTMEHIHQIKWKTR